MSVCRQNSQNNPHSCTWELHLLRRGGSLCQKRGYILDHVTYLRKLGSKIDKSHDSDGNQIQLNYNKERV